MLTEKDFKAFAEIVKNRTETTGKIDPYGRFAKGIEFVRTYLSRDLADYLATQNPRFDRQKFLDACGL